MHNGVWDLLFEGRTYLLLLLPPGDRVEKFFVFRAGRFVVFVVFCTVQGGLNVRGGDREGAVGAEGRRRRGGGFGARGMGGVGARGVVSTVGGQLRGVRRNLRLVILDHPLQAADVLDGQPEGFDFTQFLIGTAAGGVRTGRDGKGGGDVRRDVLPEGGKTIIDLLDSVSLSGVSPRNGRRLVPSRTTVRHKIDLSLAPQSVRGLCLFLRSRCRCQGSFHVRFLLRGHNYTVVLRYVRIMQHVGQLSAGFEGHCVEGLHGCHV